MTAGLETLHAQVRWLGRVIAATMVLMFAAVALPWLLRMIEVDLSALAWTLTAFAATHAALMLIAERVRSETVMLRLLYAVPLLGVGFMALLWHHGGGIGHPVLAFGLVLPIVAAAALPRPRFAFDTAIYSIVVVTVAVMIASPDFGWYATQLGVPGASLLRVGDELLTRDPFPGATTTPAASFLFVATFAAMQIAVAFAATRVVRFVSSRDELARRFEIPGGDTLPAASMRTAPTAAVVVIAATGQIIDATKRFTQQMILHNDPLTGRELLDVLTFDDVSRVRTILAEGGEIPFCRYSIGAEERIANVVAESFEHHGMRYASVVFTDWADAEWLAAAAEGLAEPLLVIGADARLRYANRAAGALFEELYTGRDVTPLLGDWWTRRDSRAERLEIAGRTYDGTATPVRLLGTDPAALVTLKPADRA